MVLGHIKYLLYITKFLKHETKQNFNKKKTVVLGRKVVEKTKTIKETLSKINKKPTEDVDMNDRMKRPLNIKTEPVDVDLVLSNNKKNIAKYNRIEKNPQIGILIVNYNNIEYTKNCVNDVINQINKNFKLYVIDQNSNETGTNDYLESIESINYITIIRNTKNIPLNWVWNKFYEICDLEYLCFLNNDIRLTNNFTDDISKIFNLESSVGAIIHVTNNIKFTKTEHKLNYEILNPPLYQGWDFTLKRSCYTKIPTNLKIFGGDDYLFANLVKNNNKIALTYSSPIIHYKERTRVKISNISQIQKNDADNYWTEINKNNLKHIGSTVPTKSNKYPPNNIKLSQNKNCIYTACIGDYDILYTSNCGKLDDWDYICFTDNKNLNSDFWKIIYVENPSDDLLNNIKLSRYYKTNPFNFLNSYENIIWKDSRILINSNLNSYLSLLKDNDMFFMKHYQANSILVEFNRVLVGRLETKEIIDKIKLKYKNNGYKYDNGLFASGILMYRNNIKVQMLFKMWWDEINENSHRDQLSLNYVLWKNSEIKYESKEQLKILGNNKCYFKPNKRTKKRFVF